MEQINKEQENIFEKYPEEVRGYLSSDACKNTIIDISKKNGLDEAQSFLVYAEFIAFMSKEAPLDELEIDFSKHLGIDPGTANKISLEIESVCIEYIRDLLAESSDDLGLYEEGVDVNRFLYGDELSETDTNVLEQTGFELIKEKEEQKETIPTKINKKPFYAAGIKIEEEKQEPAEHPITDDDFLINQKIELAGGEENDLSKNIIAQKLGGTFGLKRSENQSGPSVHKPKQSDLYREPIE